MGTQLLIISRTWLQIMLKRKKKKKKKKKNEAQSARAESTHKGVN